MGTFYTPSPDQVHYVSMFFSTANNKKMPFSNPLLPPTPHTQKKNAYLIYKWSPRYIRDNMATFLIAMHGSFLTTSKKPLPIWKNLANELFNETQNELQTRKKGLYDKLIMECSFKGQLVSE